ncbi:SIS domain-containing protein [Paraglaciecola marina]|uniref:SIS domain-containing protein n=1 Tax=Paraglaciecola marina TaxID=2500157 RepID=UPI00105D9F24|nr:SIS domain-containing protein [Paraglaciecola marina]
MTYLDYSEATLRSMDAYWTAKEIEQQPATWQKTYQMLEANKGKIEAFLRPVLDTKNIRIILTGAGTSAFVGASIAPAILKSFGGRVEAIPTTDLVSNPHEFFQEDVPTLLVSFARSGNSPESVAAFECAEKLVKNCSQIAITCNAEGALYKRCQGDNKLALLMPEETNDKSFAMTSSFSCMLLTALYVFCPSDAFEQHLTAAINATSALLKTYNMMLKSVAMKKFERVVYLGSGVSKGLAQEGALKLLELTDGQALSTFDSPLGFRHGPKAVVNDKTLVIIFISNDPYTRQYDLELLAELQNDQEVGQILSITAKSDPVFKQGECVMLDNMSEVDDTYLMFPFIASAQVYALQHSLAINNTPDNPSSSGTINRVVQGVHIHAL